MRMLRKLDTHRGRDSWCWPKGARPLGSRPSQTWAFAVCFICCMVSLVFKMAASTVTTSWHNETSWSAAVTSWHDETTSGKDDTTKRETEASTWPVHIGSITSRCSGNEPALLPPDTKERRKSSLEFTRQFKMSTRRGGDKLTSREDEFRRRYSELRRLDNKLKWREYEITFCRRLTS